MSCGVMWLLCKSEQCIEEESTKDSIQNKSLLFYIFKLIDEPTRDKTHQ